MNGTVARLTISTLLRGWRGFTLAGLPVILLALTFMVRSVVGNTHSAHELLLSGLTLGTIVPLINLIVGTGAISTEIDDGSIVYLLMKPIRRGTIVATKLAVAIVVALVFAVIPVFAACVILTGAVGSITLAFTAAAAISCVVYCSLFVMLSVLSRQAVIIGLLYMLLWENLVGGLITGARVLSVQYWAMSIGSTIDSQVLKADVNVTAAAILACVVTLGGIWYAARRLGMLAVTADA